MSKKFHLITIFCFFAFHIVHSQTSMPNKIEAFYTQEKIILDGKLTEQTWVNAEKIENFTQRELNFGQPATENTKVAIAYDKNFLYVGVWCYDSDPQKLIAKEMRRDFNYELDDNFIILIDTYQDKRNGFMFVTNPIAARADLQVFNNGSSTNAFWNGVWNVKTTTNSAGWFAEFRIPFYTLKYRTGIREQVWGINFERNIRRKREQVRWQGWSRDNQIEQVNQAGTLLGLNQLENKQFVEIKPYGIGGGEYSGENRQAVVNAGGDINYLISPTYRLNVTFNTDFAQVEADQQQINITRFPLFFPELREFFLEGDDFFNMGFGGNRIIPFYTRRIGLNENRETVPIIAGARLLGKERNSTVGIMSLQTAADGEQPTTNYTIASWRQDVGVQSVVGAMTTNTFIAGRWHTTTGVNGRYSTAKFLGDKNFNIGGAVIQTYNTDEEYNSRAYAYRFFANYLNDKISIFTSTQRSPSPFNPEVGLMRRTNFREYFGQFAWRPRPNQNGWLGWIRQFRFSPGSITYVQYDDTGELQSLAYEVTLLGLETRSGESFELSHSVVGEGLRQSFNLPGTALIIPNDTYWWREWQAQVGTFAGRTLSLQSNFTWGGYFTGTSFRSQTEVLWRANRYFNMNIRYEKNRIDLPQGILDTNLLGSRIEYAINPNVFGSMISQWNSADEELNFNFRLQIIPKIGTDFFLIVNQIYDTQNARLDSERGTILGKLIWRFTI
jgi:hypothetical protein